MKDEVLSDYTMCPMEELYVQYLMARDYLFAPVTTESDRHRPLEKLFDRFGHVARLITGSK